jgi:hypothetical protein
MESIGCFILTKATLPDVVVPTGNLSYSGD